MKWKGFKDVRATIEIDLTKSEEELWNSLDKDARWGVKKAKKEGLKVSLSNNEKIWKDFYKIYKETCKRGKIVPIDFEKIKEGKLFSCFFEAEIIAGAVVKIEEEMVTLFLNASKYEYLKFQPNNLLYWTIIKWAKEKGFKIFDLGGYQLNAKSEDKLYNINKFKLRWGGEIKKYLIYSKNPFYILGRKTIRNIHVVKKLRDKVKMWKNKEKFLEIDDENNK